MPIGIVTMLGVYIICWWTVPDRRLAVGRAREAGPEAQIHHHDLGFRPALAVRDGAGLYRLDATAGPGTAGPVTP